MSNKRVYLISGAKGFLGSCLLRRLINNNEEVHIILREKKNLCLIEYILDRVTPHISDLTDLGELQKIIYKIRPTVIYHLATFGAYSYQDDPDKIIKTNILGSWNLLKVTSQIDYELFVNTGTSSEYGFKETPMKETDLLEPASYYAVTKCSQTLLCSYTAKRDKKPIVTLRPFSVYGPYEGAARLIPKLMRSLYLKQKINLVSPEISHDQIYVDDVVDAYLLIDKLKNYNGEIFNIGTGIQSTVKEVVETAVKVTGRTTDFRWGEMKQRAWDTKNWVADISKAEKLLNWRPKIDLKKGLLLTWEWFQLNHHFYRDSC